MKHAHRANWPWRAERGARAILPASRGCHPFRWVPWIWIVCFLAFVVSAARVVVVIQRGASIYQQAARGFETSFGDLNPLDVVYVDGDEKKLEQKLDSLREDPPKLIVAIGTQAAIAAKARLRGTPLLYCLALDPVQNKLVGPNIGGVSLDVSFSRQFADIRKLLPRVRRIGVIYDEPTSGQTVRQVEKFLRPEVHLVTREASTPRQAAQFIEELMGQVDAFWLPWDPMIANPANFKLLVDSSLRHKVALIAPAAPFVAAGALMSVGPDYVKAGQRTSEMARQILAGKSPGDFRAEPPPATVLTINAPVARQLGITIPLDLRAEVLSSVPER
jgi:putative ABC transport system substrate-binding protein